jgi:hypothetical protein
MPRLFKDEHYNTPGYFRRMGSLYLLKVGKEFRLYADSHRPPPYQSLWSVQGKMDKLRGIADNILSKNESGTEGTGYVAFQSSPDLPPTLPRAITRRPRTTPPSDVYFGEAQAVEKPEPVDDTRDESPPRPKRKARKRKSVSADGVGTTPEVEVEPVEKKLLPENSTNGDTTS